MTLIEAFWLYLVPIVLASASGLGCGYLIQHALWRQCRSLNIRIIDLEQAHVQLRNKGYANKRWANQEQLEAELASLGKMPAAKPQEKFANDPMEF